MAIISKHTTGRVYDAPQVLTVTAYAIKPDDVCPGRFDCSALFSDEARHIHGRLEIPFTDIANLHKDLMQSYDAGAYDSLSATQYAAALQEALDQ